MPNIEMATTQSVTKFKGFLRREAAKSLRGKLAYRTVGGGRGR